MSLSSLSLSLSRALFLFIVVVKVVVAMSERDEKRERDENAGKIEDEIEALKAIYGDEMVREEEEEDEDEEEGVAMKSSGGREGKDERTKRRLLRVVFSPSARAILSMDCAFYPSRKPFEIEEMKTPDNFDWDFEKAVRETKDEMYTNNNNNNNNNEVFAFEFIEKCKEMFEREELEAKKRDEKEKEDNERYARERREKQKHMSEDDSKMKAAIFKDHLVSWKHEGDPKVTPLLETELAADVRKRFKSHPIVCYEKCRFQAHTCRGVTTIKEIKIALKLIILDTKVQTATHPRIFAYRIPNDDDFNDDGETGAGKNLANILRLRGAENVFVAVTRWFGGTHLGPQRFKVINSCASQALEAVGAKGFEKK